MATSNKAQDPEAAALSAIEEALNLAVGREGFGEAPKEPSLSTPVFPKASDPDKTPKIMRRGEIGADPTEAKAPPPPPFEDLVERGPSRLPEVDDHPLFAAKRPDRRAERKRGAEPSMPVLPEERGERLSPPTTPANDDRHSVGPILRALNQKPSGLPQALAIIFSVLWLVLVGAYLFADRANIAAQGGFLRPTSALYLMLAIGPVLFFIVTAMLVRRTQEMRFTARSMAEIAMRLAEPETIASEQIVTLSQAIRREIVSMGDGIERALARAGELETLVRSEVSNLERSYSENERRIKALVDGLSSEREHLLSNAERMRSAISGMQETFAQDIDSASIRITENLGNTASHVTSSLGAKGEEIRSALSQAGEELIANLLMRGEDIISRLEQTQHYVGQSLADTGTAISDGLLQRVGEIDTNLRGAGEALIAGFVEQLDDAGMRIASTLNEGGGHITTTLEQANNRLNSTLSETLTTITVQSGEMNDRLSMTAQETLTALVNHIDTMQETVGTAAQQTLDTFTYHASSLNERFAETVGEAVSAIA
ncbi:MAG TPA: hypothetical protein VL492_07950, partial [Methylovirgula sp.]|nr:hypothetical protein [Methylovirgula sp.]